MIPFGERLRAAVAEHGPLCVGIDPHAALLRAWGLDDSATGAREFGLRVVGAAAGRVAIVKPQVSFFERFGSVGFAALEDVLAAARDAGVLTIADAKRGDIGSTMDAYAEAWLPAGAPLEADAMTASPYLGVGALDGAFEIAAAHGKGIFVLAATSNPEGESVQRAEYLDDTLAAFITDEVAERNASAADGSWGSVGVVIGATVDHMRAGLGMDLDPATPILAPGFGVQGAGPEDLVRRFRAAAPRVLASESRSILSAGPEGLVGAIDARRAEYAEVLHG